MIKAALFATVGAVLTIILFACGFWFTYLWIKNKIEKLFKRNP